MSTSRSLPSAVTIERGAHLADRLGHDLGVGRGERGVVAVRHRDPLAAERVVRRELLAQLGIRHLAARGAGGRSPRTARTGAGSRSSRTRWSRARGRCRRAGARCVSGQAPEERALEVGERGGRGRAGPTRACAGRRAAARPAAGCAGTNWTAEAPGADHRRRARRSGRGRGPSRPSGSIVPSKPSRPGMSGSDGLDQPAHPADQHVGASAGPARSRAASSARVLVPRRRRSPRVPKRMYGITPKSSAQRRR